ncbi:MAG: hypothetical protein LBU56_00525 [Rickettsiales bacterium]|nr:hypothetical protein [Rickettsiales bacterium]
MSIKPFYVKIQRFNHYEKTGSQCRSTWMTKKGDTWITRNGATWMTPVTLSFQRYALESRILLG